MDGRSRLVGFALLVCGLLLLGQQTCFAQADQDDGWVRLGDADTSHADADLNKVEFVVQNHDQAFTKIRIRNHGPAVRFTEIDILFVDGQTQKIELDKPVGNGGDTGALPLKGKTAHQISKVVAVYKVVGHHRAAGMLSLWGFVK